jgi:hypothetical protein
MPETVLLRHSKLLRLKRVTGKLAWFREADGVAQHAIEIDLWKEMGRPDVITYILEVGDTLNG